MIAKNSPRPKRTLQSRCARLMLRLWVVLPMSAVLCLLTACAGEERVVLRAVSLPPVADELRAPIKPPQCAPKPSEAYPPETLEAERRCLVRAEDFARAQHGRLASAVSVREAKAAELARAK